MAKTRSTTRGWRREALFAAWFGGFGLLVLPFLVYLAGILTLGPYDGGLPEFLKALFGAALRLKPSAWPPLTGPYLMFVAARLLTRPLRRRS